MKEINHKYMSWGNMQTETATPLNSSKDEIMKRALVEMEVLPIQEQIEIIDELKKYLIGLIDTRGRSHAEQHNLHAEQMKLHEKYMEQAKSI